MFKYNLTLQVENWVLRDQLMFYPTLVFSFCYSKQNFEAAIDCNRKLASSLMHNKLRPKRN